MLKTETGSLLEVCCVASINESGEPVVHIIPSELMAVTVSPDGSCELTELLTSQLLRRLGGKAMLLRAGAYYSFFGAIRGCDPAPLKPYRADLAALHETVMRATLKRAMGKEVDHAIF